MFKYSFNMFKIVSLVNNKVIIRKRALFMLLMFKIVPPVWNKTSVIKLVLLKLSIIKIVSLLGKKIRFWKCALFFYYCLK